MLVRNVFKHSHELESVDIEDQERVDRWLAEISVLVDDFRECRELFPVNRVSTSSLSGTIRARLMTTDVVQWKLARSIRNAKMLEGELEEENMLERLENEVGKEMGQLLIFPCCYPTELFCRYGEIPPSRPTTKRLSRSLIPGLVGTHREGEHPVLRRG